MELKDIVLKKGDVIYFGNECNYSYFGDENGKLSDYYIPEHVVRIERPVKIKYETIYEKPKQILDKEEKEWLESFLKPFKSTVEIIEKNSNRLGEYIYIQLNTRAPDYIICLPTFKAGTMYKGMELDKKYTLKELGLFKE